MADRTLVSQVTDAIAFRIVSGKYVAGEHLPSVRKLAVEFEINPSTVQVVLARLESSGFVNARQASGVTVKDVEQFGSIETWKYIFRFAQQIPDRAVRICKELLSFRTLIITEALKRIQEDPSRYSTASFQKAIESFEHVLKTSPEDVLEISYTQIQAVRSILIATEQTVVTAIANSISEVYVQVPAIMQVMSKDPQLTLEAWKFLLKEWEAQTLSDQKIKEAKKLLKLRDEELLLSFKEIVMDPNYQPEIPKEKKHEMVG